MKESPERCTNPILPDEENYEVKSTANLENGKFQKSLEPANVCSESIEKAKEVYIDKNVTCYEDDGFNDVKDICVDEGLSHGEIINKEHHEVPCSPIIVDGDKHDDMIKDDLDTQLICSSLEEKMKLFVESNVEPDNTMPNGEEKLDSSSDLVDDSVKVLELADNGVDDVGQQLSENAGSEVNDSKQTDTAIDIPNEIKTEKNTISNPDIMKPTSASDPDELLLNTESAPNSHDTASKNLAAVARGGSESSFSTAGPGLITYSGPITAYGNISHRSDGSNSSVRSFAFPILPNEWNSSPIRMAKADPKQSRKHRGWRQTFICCGF